MSKTYETFLQSGKLNIDSLSPGPRVAIMAGVHGNEPCGLLAFQKIFETGLQIQKGSVTFLLGSKKAVEHSVRAYECNLNRMFRRDEQLTETEKASYEYPISRAIMKELDEVDVLLDIHSSPAGDTRPFVICETHSFPVATLLPVKTIVRGLDTFHPLGTDGYMNSIGKQGLCIECGNHNDPGAVTAAVEAVYRLLSGLRMIEKDFGSDELLLTKEYIEVVGIYKAKQDFTACKSFADFEKVEAGTLVGYDADREVRMESDGVVLFMANKASVGEEAFVYGREIVIER
jgi:succinylglutamate desuccinylase